MKNIRPAVFAAALAAAAMIPSAVYADLFTYNIIMSGPQESPANASPGTGSGFVEWDDEANTMRVNVSFTGLTGTTTAAHIHAPTPSPFFGTAGVATQTPSFSGFPLGVTAGAMDNTFDMTLASSYNPSYITANGGSPATAMVALKAAIDAGRSYFNIHTSTFGGGEIRGFLLNPVPEPSTWALLICGAAGVGLLVRRGRR